MAKKKKVAKKAKSKKKVSPGPGFKGYVGSTTGLSVSDYWQKLFLAQPKNKLTDPQIGEAMAKEFPNAKRYTPKDIVVFRNRYNNGNLVTQDKAPKDKVAEYITCTHCKRGVRIPMWGEKGRVRKASSPSKKKVAKKKGHRVSKTVAKKATKKKATKKKAKARK